MGFSQLPGGAAIAAWESELHTCRYTVELIAMCAKVNT